MKVAFARALQNPVDEREKPRGYSRETAYIFFDGGVAYLFDLLFPFTHEHDRLVGGLHHVGPKRGVGNQYGRQVSIATIVVRLGYFRCV